MAFNVSEFSAVINRRGLAVSNLFVMSITPPQGFMSGITPQELTFFCRSVDIPDMSLRTAETKTFTYGGTQTFPTGMDPDVLTCEFMVDQEMNVIKFFNKWIQMIYNYDTEGGDIGGRGAYELNYKNLYLGAIDVAVYSGHSAKDVYNVKYNKAFPVMMKMPQLSWDNAAEIMILPVSFRYSGFRIDGSIRNSMDTINSSSGVDFPQFLKDINNIKKQVNEFGQLLKDF